MSFCRFSDDDHRCDFYAYESAHGFELYLAKTRVDWEPLPSALSPEALELPPQEWAARHAAYMEALNNAPRHPINHPEAGGHFIYQSLPELRGKIAELSQQGFITPDWLLPSLDQEIAEQEQRLAKQDR